MLTLLLAGALAAPVPGDALNAPAPPPVKAFLVRSDLQEAIRAAVADAPQRERHAVYSNHALDRFSIAFEEARVPDCLHPDGLKRQPTGFLLGGFMYVGVSGVNALPFVAIAKLRCKCN